jgi:hypothetical protein
LLRSAKQDLLRNGGLVRAVEKRFANLGSDMGSRQLNRKLENRRPAVIKNRITFDYEKCSIPNRLLRRRT